MTVTTAALCVRPMDQADMPAILDLLQASMAGGPTGQRTAAFYRWKHEDNPFGPSIALVAAIDGRVVGLRTFMRWRFLRDGEPVTAVRAVDTATHPDFQGRGIFSRLTLAALDVARTDTDLVFNTPNGNSRPGYLKMGWQVVGDVPIAIRVRRPVAFALGLRSAAAPVQGVLAPGCPLPPAAEVLADGAAVDALLARTAAVPGRLSTDRSAAYLRWRYAEAPGLGYRGVAVHRDEVLVGLAIGRPRWRGTLAELTLSEVLVADGDAATARALLRAVAHGGCDHVAAHLAGSPTAAREQRRCGYLVAPRQGMTLTCRPLGGTEPLHLDDWALTLGDLEVF